MSRDPRVSAIIIFLDEANFLAEAIESVLAQTFEDWQLLLVDDGSTDGSSDIARDYAARHAGRVRCLEHEGHANRGMSASRNLGLAHARGEFVAFLDGDDVWEADKLAAQVPVLQADPALAMTYGRTLVWYSWRQAADQPADYLKPLGLQPGQVVSPPRLLVTWLEDEFTCPGCGSVLLRREAVENVGGLEDAFGGQYEDMVLYAKLLLRYPVCVEGATYSRYRQHAGNDWVADRRASRWYPEWLTPSRGRYLEWVADYVGRHGPLRSPELDRALRAALWPYRHPVRYAGARGYHLARYYLRQALRRGVAGPG
jgi:glycosyltransferase involved in cell wall biosynthesis